MDAAQIISSAASVLCTVIVGTLSFFLKSTLDGLKNADKQNAEQIEKVRESLNSLKAELPFLYETREDSIRAANRIEEKLDKLLYAGGSGGKGDS